ncbi:hypothetical protein L6164_010713 [Bauhinia variegata]|uniref:Uncharacterized protein n=1 Tax=Bauhinia variegata TaxID=167791 RepID=A0ACB9P5M2_BAUVA|nr:hypothetical protein L6164_010713 [Bauhinia variegata]
MSENHVVEGLSEGYGGAGSGKQEIEGNRNENDYPPTALDPHEVSNSTNNHGAQLIEQLNEASQFSSNQIERSDPDNGVLGTEQGDPEDAKSIEDSAKDDMFVDCPDELSTLDVRQTDSKEEAEAGETEEKLEEDQALQQQSHFIEQANGVGGGSPTHQPEQLRHMLANTVSEKESIAREYQEERETLAQALLNLHYQLKALTGQQSVPYEAEVVVRNKEAQMADKPDIPLEEIINECLELASTSSEERSKTEATMRNFQSLLYTKDKEIEDLNTKITELSISNDVIQKSLEASSEIQLEKDPNVDNVIDTMVSSLATVVNQEQAFDNSIGGKIVHIAEGTSLLIKIYNQIRSEIDQLRHSFSEVGLDTTEEDYGTVLVSARFGLLELKRKEEELVEKLAQLEDEKQKMLEELDKERVMIGTLNSELGNIKAELEQEKTKCASTREKLSMAVTKGKALVQQRDSLKHSLADKSSELDKCMIELQDKSAALEAAVLTKEELVRSENMVASLQNSLLKSNTIIEQVEEILSQTEPDKLELLDIPARLRWLVDDRNVLKGVYLEFSKLRDALSLVDLPESVSSSDLETQMNWLRDSFHRVRNDVNVLQEEISSTEKAAHHRIDNLRASLLLELQEKDYLQSELTDLRYEYEDIVEKNHLISLEKDQIVEMLVELSGLNLEDEGTHQSSSDIFMIMNRCIQMIKEQGGPFSRSSHIDAELFERIQSLLYVRDQELTLYEDILEEEMLIQLDVNKLSNELKVTSEEILVLKEEKDSLQKDLERSEEKSGVLRDKLSMAVKKGKGLVQDRDNLISLLNEKNSEIEKLKIDLQKQEADVSEYRDHISRLSSNVESIPKLEADLLAVKNKRNQFEQFLLESNKMLQRVIESIDGIVLPVDSVFEEPVEKVKWLASYVSECNDAKLKAEQELHLVKEGSSILESKLEEVQATVKSLEQVLSSSENSISQLAEEKRDLELQKAEVEEELQKVKEEAAEFHATAISHEDALSRDISFLSIEKHQAEIGRTAAETELETVKEEAARQASKLAEASTAIKDLEDTLSQVENNLSILTEKYTADQVVKTNMENKLKKLKDESGYQASQLADASETIKSLEDALTKAQSEMSALEDANKSAKEEISSLNFKLNTCLDDLAGKKSSSESRSAELIGLLNDLWQLMKEDTVYVRAKDCFERKFESLRNMDLILSNTRDLIIGMIAKGPERQFIMEEDLHVRKAFPGDLENLDINLDNGEINDTDIDKIILLVGKIVKGFQLRNKLIADRFDDFSDSIDVFITPIRAKLLETETDITTISELVETLKEKVNTMEIYKEEKENAIAMLENDVALLLSACANATSELQTEVEKDFAVLGSITEVEKLNDHADSRAGHDHKNKYTETVQKLINATREAKNLIKHFEFKGKEAAATVDDLQNKLEEARATSEKVTEERDLNQNRISQLESDIQVLQSSCYELKNNLEGYHVLEEKLKEKEAEISSLHSTLSSKEQEAESSLLSASEVSVPFDKVDRIEISVIDSGEDLEPHTSAPVKKLFNIVDSVTTLHNQIKSLSHDKEELQSTLATQVLERKHLEEELENLNRNWEDSEKVKNELSGLIRALERILEMLGASDWAGDRKSAGLEVLIPELEKQVMAILLESENSKSKSQEFGSKLLASQEVVDELTTKVKLLEDSLQGRASQPEIVQERSLFEAPSLPAGSVISEVEEGSLGKKAISPVPSAAHVRNMRKGSSDHLELDIDVESDRLIHSADADEDKGHVFKSLNTSGLVPKQGKLIADRIDGIWVSGGRVLMSRPRARLGLIGYLLVLHIWLLGTIL